MEAQLLRFFLANEGKVLDRARILDGVWHDKPDTTSRVVDMTVLGLRKKLEPDPEQPRFLLSVRGVGYRFSRRADQPLTEG